MECTRLVAVAVAVAAAPGMLAAGFGTSPAVAATPGPGPATPGAIDPAAPVINVWASGSFRVSNRAW